MLWRSLIECARSNLGCGWRRREGSIAIIFAVTLGVMLLVVGGAVDFGRWLSARNAVRSAVDKAVIAGARTLQIEGRNALAAVDVAQRYYDRNLRVISGLEGRITFRVIRKDTALIAEGKVFIDTPLLALAGIRKLPVLILSEANAPEAFLAEGAKSETDIEVALMLDTSGSMLGGRLENLKQAVNDLIDIVVWDDQSSHASRVALVPFADAIRIDDPALVSLVVRPSPSRFRFTDIDGNTRIWRRDPACATDRVGAAAYLDDAPEGPDQFNAYYSADGTCDPKYGAIVPLTNDKTRLRSKLDMLSTGGETAGHLGIAWTWYLLSPRWAGVLPADGRPAPYSLQEQRTDSGAPLLRKIAVLMSDSEFNLEYCDGVDDAVINCDAPNGNSIANSQHLCANMKAAGITIFSVGFDISEAGATASALQRCASSPSTYYLAQDTGALRQAYRDIALRISQIHVTQGP